MPQGLSKHAGLIVAIGGALAIFGVVMWCTSPSGPSLTDAVPSASPPFFVIELLVGLFFALLPLILIARISHWTHKTQERLLDTNRLLAMIVDRNTALDAGGSQLASSSAHAASQPASAALTCRSCGKESAPGATRCRWCLEPIA